MGSSAERDAEYAGRLHECRPSTSGCPLLMQPESAQLSTRNIAPVAFIRPHYGDEAAASRGAKAICKPMDYRTYASPFSWRYGRAELRSLFSEETRRRLWRAVWVALAEAQASQGLIAPTELDDLRAHAGEIDIDAALAIEREDP